jgi:hypothetical protein
MNQYLMPAARNSNTREVVKQQDLAGRRFSLVERGQAQLWADRLAEDMTARTRQDWRAELIEYSA